MSARHSLNTPKNPLPAPFAPGLFSHTPIDPTATMVWEPPPLTRRTTSAQDRRAMWAVGLVALVVFLVVAFAVRAALAPAPLPNVGAANAQHVTQRQFGLAWPLTVNSGVLRCERAGEVTFTAGGVTYALNPAAERRKVYAPAREIWVERDNQYIQGRDLRPLVRVGLALCAQNAR